MKRFGGLTYAALLGAMIILGLLVVSNTESTAAVSYAIGSGGTITINEHGICRNVRNNAGNTVFVPTRTYDEWVGFINRAPNVTISACCTSNGAGGYCWYIGAAGQSCDTVCAGRGGVNLSGTRDWAGSGGNASNCQQAIAAAYGNPSYAPYYYVYDGYGLSSGGCQMSPYFYSAQNRSTPTSNKNPLLNFVAESIYSDDSGSDSGSGSSAYYFRANAATTTSGAAHYYASRVCACNG